MWAKTSASAVGQSVITSASTVGQRHTYNLCFYSGPKAYDLCFYSGSKWFIEKSDQLIHACVDLWSTALFYCYWNMTIINEHDQLYSIARDSGCLPLYFETFWSKLGECNTIAYYKLKENYLFLILTLEDLKVFCSLRLFHYPLSL